MDFIARPLEYVLRADIPGVHKVGPAGKTAGLAHSCTGAGPQSARLLGRPQSEIRVSVDANVVRFGHQPHPDREQKDE